MNTPESVATTDANGLYLFRNLDAGIYRIEAIAPTGYTPTREETNIELRPVSYSEGGIIVVRSVRDFFFRRN
jgi:hypothetical protein